MVPNAAQGGNQAMESVAVLLNELEKARSKGRIQADLLEQALSRYSEQRKPRASKIQKMAGMICRTQMMPNGDATSAAFQELPRLTDADWLFRGFMGFVGAPSLNGIPLTKKGKFFDEALSSFEQKFARHELSNAELFGMT
jgi:FAD dependent monooxygenase